MRTPIAGGFSHEKTVAFYSIGMEANVVLHMIVSQPLSLLVAQSALDE